MITDVHELLALNKVQGRWPVGVQAGLALAGPVLVAGLLGHLPLGLMTGTGAFTVLYAVHEPWRQRLRTLTCVGLGMVGAAVVGVLTHHQRWLHLGALVLLGMVAAAVSRMVRLGPPGAYFFVLVGGIAGFVANHRPGIQVVGMSAVGALVAIATGVAGSLLKPGPADQDHDHFPQPEDWPEARGIALRVGAASLIAGVMATLLPMHHPYWAIATAMLVLHQGGPARAQVVRGVQRLLGTLLGLGVYAALLQWGPHGLWVALVVFVLQFVVEMLVVRNYGAAVVFITPLALTIAGAAGGHESAARVITERAAATGLAVCVALIVLAASTRWTVFHRVVHTGDRTTAL